MTSKCATGLYDGGAVAFQATFMGTVQNVSYTGTAGQSAAVASTTTVVRLCASTDCFYLVGSNPTVTVSTGAKLNAGVVERIGIKPGEKISVIQLSTGGSLNIVEGAA